MSDNGLVFWLKLERAQARQLLNVYELGIDRISCRRLGRQPEDITQAEIERLKKRVCDLNSFIGRCSD